MIKLLIVVTILCVISTIGMYCLLIVASNADDAEEAYWHPNCRGCFGASNEDCDKCWAEQRKRWGVPEDEEPNVDVE